MIISRRKLHRMRNVPYREPFKKSKQNFMLKKSFPKIMPFIRKCGRTQNALLCFIATVVAAAHHNVMLCVHCLSYLLLSSTDSVTNINILAVNQFP